MKGSHSLGDKYLSLPQGEYPTILTIVCSEQGHENGVLEGGEVVVIVLDCSPE